MTTLAVTPPALRMRATFLLEIEMSRLDLNAGLTMKGAPPSVDCCPFTIPFRTTTPRHDPKVRNGQVTWIRARPLPAETVSRRTASPLKAYCL